MILADSAGHNLAVASIQHVDLDDDENNLKFQFGYNAPEEYRQWLASLHNLAGERLEAKRRSEELASRFDVNNSIYSNEDYQSAAKALRLTGMLSILSSDWRKSRALFEDVWIGNKTLDHKEKGKALTDLFEARSGRQDEEARLSKLSDAVSETFNGIRRELEEKGKYLQQVEVDIQNDLNSIGSNIHDAEAFISGRSWGDLEVLFSSVEFLSHDVALGLSSERWPLHNI